MSLARDPSETWIFQRPRLSAGAVWTGLYVVAGMLATARAYMVGYDRYAPEAGQGGDSFAFTLAQSSGLWAATATAASAFILFLALLALRQAGARLLRGGRRGA